MDYENKQEIMLTGVTLDNDTAKKIAVLIASKIPKVGGVLSGLISVFWPSTEVSLWDQIKDQVEALVNQKIAENNLNQLKQTLSGIKNDVREYNTLTNPAQKLAKLEAIDSNINATLPKFLSGDPASGFSVFWGIALLHLSVRKERCEMVKLMGKNDAANEKLLHESTVRYCAFARVALSLIYNRRVSEINMAVISENEPGKASNWVIEVEMTDTRTHTQMFYFSQRYRKNEWNEDVLNERTAWCNGEIAGSFGWFSRPLEEKLHDWAWEAVSLLEAEHRYTQKEALDLLKLSMTDDDYKDFTSKYYVSGSIYNNPETSRPVERTKNFSVQLNPFRRS